MKTLKCKQFLPRTQEARGLPHTPTRINSPEPSSELPRPVEKLLAEEDEKEQEEEEEEEVVVVVVDRVEVKAGFGIEEGLG